MSPKNNGRKGKRQRSGGIKSPKKKARTIFPLVPTDKTNIEETDYQPLSQPTNPSESTPLKLTTFRRSSGDSYTVSSQTLDTENKSEPSPKADESSNSLFDMSAIDSTQDETMATNQPQIISDNDFKFLVLEKLGKLESQMGNMNQRFQKLEDVTRTHNQDIRDLKKSNNDEQTENIQELKTKVLELENKLKEKTSSPKPKIVIKNLWREEWSTEKKHTETNKLLKSIDPNAPDVLKIETLGKSKNALVTLGENHTIGEVMKKKSCLKNNKEYSKVFIEPQKSITEQKQEASLRMLARATNGLKFRRGQIVADENNTTGPKTKNNNATTQDDIQKDGNKNGNK